MSEHFVRTAVDSKLGEKECAMRRFVKSGRLVGAVAAFILFHGTCFAQAAGGEHWVTSWATAQVQAPAPRLGTAGQAVNAAQQALAGFSNQTIRMVVPCSIGGRRVRVQFSDAYSSAPLRLGAAHVAIHEKNSAIVAGSDRVLSFGGDAAISVPAGATVISDPVDLDVPALGELAVTVYVAGTSGAPSMHALGLHTTYISPKGNLTAEPMMEDPATTQSWYWLSAVDVLAPARAATIIAFGDSITDGARSTPDANHGWTFRLAQRMLVNSEAATTGIANLGIAGNRILKDGVGPSGLSRFGRDALEQAGARWVVVLEGINDIGQASGPNAAAADGITADEVIGGLRQLAEQAHIRGLKVIGATLLPYQGAMYFSEQGETIRESVNTWIRSATAFDAVIDFDAVMRNASNPKQLRPEFDAGDHLHPNDTGYEAMAATVDLAIFADNPPSASSGSRGENR
jgi:lysophospholipase L1-like esterase